MPDEQVADKQGDTDAEREDRRADDSSGKDTASPEAPGPADHGGSGGMATREVAPEVAHRDD